MGPAEGTRREDIRGRHQAERVQQKRHATHTALACAHLRNHMSGRSSPESPVCVSYSCPVLPVRDEQPTDDKIFQIQIYKNGDSPPHLFIKAD